MPKPKPPTPEEAAIALFQYLIQSFPRGVEYGDWFPEWLIAQLSRFFRGEPSINA